MGIDIYLQWNGQTESFLKNLAIEIANNVRNGKGMQAPEFGSLRERYGLIYNFYPVLFKEAWDYNNRGICRISTAEFRRRANQILQDLRENKKESMQK